MAPVPVPLVASSSIQTIVRGTFSGTVASFALSPPMILTVRTLLDGLQVNLANLLRVAVELDHLAVWRSASTSVTSVSVMVVGVGVVT
jgi:hypothetical protein